MGRGDRKAKPPLPRLTATPRRKKQGRARMQEIARERDLENVVLVARSRQCGGADVEAMKSQMLGDDAGKAIWIVCGQDAAKAYEAFNGLRNAQERYHRLVLGKSLHAKTAKIETMPERFETRPDDQPDLRTEDERHRDAINSYQSWIDRLNQLPLSQAASIQSVIHGWLVILDAGTVTQKGREFCAAVLALADEFERSTRRS